MNRTPRILHDLSATLDSAAEFVARGRVAFDSDPALPLAFEALTNRVGDLCTQLLALEPARFTHPSWKLAARNRDFVAHRYHHVDPDVLWNTAAASFPQLAQLVAAAAERD